VSSDPYQAYPSFPAGGPARLIEPPAVQLVAAGPVKQRRLTVAFRLILVIPQIFVLFFVNLAGFVVAFLGWWAALFTGRLPAFAVSYLSGLARWNARVYGYLYLLTDVYPPFTLDDNLAYPVVIAIPEQGRLNRFAVFFRFILMLWGYIVVNVVTSGVNTIVAFIAWLITLITGQLPAPLHLAFTAVLRYQTRYYCYLSLLTPTYPWKLFGDEPEASAPVTAAPTAETAAPAESPWGTPPAYGGTPAYGTPPGYGAMPPYGTTPGYGATPAYGAPASGYGTPGGYGSAPAPRPVSWPLVLPRSAKNLLIVFIALGLISSVGSQYASAKLRHWVANSIDSRTLAISNWNTANNALNANMNHWQTAVQACDQKLSCVTAADGQAASSMSAFASQVRAIAMPSDAASDATQLAAGATKVAQDFTTLSQATTVAQYQSAVTSTGLSQDLTRVQNGIGNVAHALDNS
jgi:Domain of unknown function (DUF4389)